jgi:hypothetical protein
MGGASSTHDGVEKCVQDVSLKISYKISLTEF